MIEGLGFIHSCILFTCMLIQCLYYNKTLPGKKGKGEKFNVALMYSPLTSLQYAN